MNIFLNKELDVNEYELAVLAALNGMYSTKFDELETHVNIIYKFLVGTYPDTHNMRDRVILKNIKLGIKGLINKELVECAVVNDFYTFNKKNLQVDTKENLFTIIRWNEIQTIFQNAKKPFSLLYFFYGIVCTINPKTKEWHMSQDSMVASWGYGKGTVNDYMKQLEELKLIYVYRHKVRRADGTFRKINNSYGRYEDKDAIISEAKVYVYDVETEEDLSRLDRRTIKMRYNAFCKGSKKYVDNPGAVKDLYEDCVMYNKSLENKQIEVRKGDEYSIREPLNLSMFPENIRLLEEVI